MLICLLQDSAQPGELPRYSLVGKSVTWNADGRGLESHLWQPIFL